MVFEWSSRYAVDVRDVDDQHKHFVDVVNSLFEAMAKGVSPHILAETLDALNKHAEEHFRLEQNYMRECRYPETERHISEHLAFSETLKALQTRVQSEDPKLFTVRLAAFLRDWLMEHVQREDKLLFSYRASVHPPSKP